MNITTCNNFWMMQSTKISWREAGASIGFSRSRKSNANSRISIDAESQALCKQRLDTRAQLKLITFLKAHMNFADHTLSIDEIA